MSLGGIPEEGRQGLFFRHAPLYANSEGHNHLV